MFGFQESTIGVLIKSRIRHDKCIEVTTARKKNIVLSTISYRSLNHVVLNEILVVTILKGLSFTGGINISHLRGWLIDNYSLLLLGFVFLFVFGSQLICFKPTGMGGGSNVFLFFCYFYILAL